MAVVDDAFFAAVGAAGIFFLRTVDELILVMIQQYLCACVVVV